MLYKIISDDLKAWALIHIWGLANSLSFIFQVHWEDTNSKVEYVNPNFETKEVSKQVDESRL